jgi:hypothetical protein
MSKVRIGVLPLAPTSHSLTVATTSDISSAARRRPRPLSQPSRAAASLAIYSDGTPYTRVNASRYRSPASLETPYGDAGRVWASSRAAAACRSSRAPQRDRWDGRLMEHDRAAGAHMRDSIRVAHASRCRLPVPTPGRRC